ncbi:MAG: hypothetical protein ABEK04_04360, partial [Candidatus Nanohalobium sp.]
VNKYDSAEEKKEEIENEREERGMSESEFAVFKLLTLENNVDESKASEISKDIGERLQEVNIGVNYRQAKDEIRREVIYALKENNQIELAKTDFLEKAVKYIFENKKDA